MKNSKKLLSKLGYRKVASILNENLPTVYKWGERGIPHKHWYRMALAFQISIEELNVIRAKDTIKNQ